ncbi:CEL-like protein [Mya arenaria]|uniref:CEL-like protein n=1 Tax=Mya arenaria TaxID=6604 RepID=A0ABY7EDI7_MYAAR|nr:CEL-like protein [Mya arenaria]
MVAARLMLVLGVLALGHPCAGQAVTVRTLVGEIMGSTEQVAVDGRPYQISRFLSIPFAETTGGQNRFRKPIPKAPFTDVFNATQMPMGCFQGSLGGAAKYGKYMNFTEDCLTLNIYVPHAFAGNPSLPVMVWIYGGAFVEGATAIYPGEGMAALGDVILVTVNYRVGMFGFIRSANGDLPGNQGLWDQHLAIKWVHNNIAAFTGNPNDVTIFGESAGAASVVFQALYSGNKGLFRRVIAQSGSANSYWAIHNGPNAEAFIQKKGCGGSPDPAGCLRALEPTMIMDQDTLPMRPVVDNDFLVADPKNIMFENDPKTAAARNFFSSLDFLTGFNEFDGALYVRDVWPSLLGYTDMDSLTVTREQFSKVVVPITVSAAWPSANNATAEVLGRLVDFMYTNWSRPDDSVFLRNALVELSSDIAFFGPAISTVHGHASLGGGRTFLYRFSVTPTTHALKTPLWIEGHYTNLERQVSHAAVTMWTNFAKTGDPNKPTTVLWYTNTTWPEYDVTSQAYIHLNGNGAAVGSRFAARRMEMWQHLFPAVADIYDCNKHAQGPDVPIFFTETIWYHIG